MLVAALSLVLVCTCASAGIDTTLGNVVTISGYSSASPYVYLFLTGPNLPVNGVALHDITQRADQGGSPG
jgi:hypothetical protein